MTSLAKNSQLRTGKLHQIGVRAAKRQMRDDVTNLMKAATWPPMALPLRMDATITTRTNAHKDDDGAIAGLAPARDAIAEALSIDDTDIISGRITFEKGAQESTVIEVVSAAL